MGHARERTIISVERAYRRRVAAVWAALRGPAVFARRRMQMEPARLTRASGSTSTRVWAEAIGIAGHLAGWTVEDRQVTRIRSSRRHRGLPGNSASRQAASGWSERLPS